MTASGPLRLNIPFLPDVVPLRTVRRDNHFAAAVDSVTSCREPKRVVGSRDRQPFPDAVLNARTRVHDVCPAELIGSAELVVCAGKQRVERAVNPVAGVPFAGSPVEFGEQPGPMVN